MAGGQRKRGGVDKDADKPQINKKQKSKDTTQSTAVQSKKPTKAQKESKAKVSAKETEENKALAIPSLAASQPARESFLVCAGTYERLLYGLEARFAGDQLAFSAQFIIPAHIGCIKAVSTGGRYLASGSTDESIRLYDLKKRVELGSLHEHQGTISALQFHGQSHLLSASSDGAICIYRTKDWEPLKVLRGHNAAVTDLAIHPTGKLALSVSTDRTIIVWNLLTGQRASRSTTPQPAEAVAWSPQGTLYVVGYGSEIQVYRVGQAEAVATVFCRQRVLAITVVSHDGNDYVVAGCQDGCLRIYAEDGREMGTVKCHTNRIKGLDSLDVVFPGDTDQEVARCVLATISSDGRIKAWRFSDLLASAADAMDIEDGKKLDLAEPLANYNADVRLTCVAVSNNNF
ncbi:60s ribosome biogenesis protein mak11 [Coemansia sp. Benny D115]|nr:60s ribosome biogenesis protein mak11 [Coemansia sp. Benny D115]